MSFSRVLSVVYPVFSFEYCSFELPLSLKDAELINYKKGATFFVPSKNEENTLAFPDM